MQSTQMINGKRYGIAPINTLGDIYFGILSYRITGTNNYKFTNVIREQYNVNNINVTEIGDMIFNSDIYRFIAILRRRDGKSRIIKSKSKRKLKSKRKSKSKRKLKSKRKYY